MRTHTCLVVAVLLASIAAAPFAEVPTSFSSEGAAVVVRFTSSLEETFAFENPETQRVLVVSYSDGFQCAPTVDFAAPLVQRVVTPVEDTHQLNLASPMYSRVYGPATMADFLADPCGFIQATERRIAEGHLDAGGVRIHATDSEFLGPLVFVQGPGPGARTVHASWIGRMTDLVNGGNTNLSMHVHVLFRPGEMFGEFRFEGPTLTPDPLGLQ